MKKDASLSIQGAMKEIVSGSGVAFVMKFAAAMAAFLFNLLLARLLGADELGLFYLALTCCSIAMIVGQIGLGQVLIRHVALYSSDKNWILVVHIMKKGLLLAFFVSLIMTIVTFFIAPWISSSIFHKDQLSLLLRWMTLTIVPGTLYVLYGFGLQGLCKIRDSVFISSFLMPVFSIITVSILIQFFGLIGSVWGYCLASFFTLLIASRVWKSSIPHHLSEPTDFSTLKLLSSCLPLFIISISQLFISWSSNISLGIWGSTVDIGVFNVANRTAMLIGFVLASVNTIAAPKFASIYGSGNMRELEIIAVKTTKLMLLVAFPLLLLLVIYPDYIMAVFGKSFKDGATLLRILVIGQFINVSTGSVGYLLTMSGREKIMRKVMIISALLIIVLNIILIPIWGAIGAALATAIALSAQNLFAAIAVWRKMGIITIPFISVFIKRNNAKV